MRKSNGTFKSVDELLAIRGLGQKRLEKMRKYLTVGKTLRRRAKVRRQTQPTRTPPQNSPLPLSIHNETIILRLRSRGDRHRETSG
jgi:hypothetical protein